MEHAPTAPSLRQIQVPPPQKRKRVQTLHIRRIKLAGGRLEYRIPVEIARGAYAQLWCDKADRKATEQRLVEENTNKYDHLVRASPRRVKFYTLK